MENLQQDQKKQTVVLTNRKQLSLDGVVDVKSFDDMLVCLETNLGILNIEGKQLKITKYIMQTGEIGIEGAIDAFVYMEPQTTKKGFWSKITR